MSRIKISKNLTILLIPRVRVDFIVTKVEGYERAGISILKYLMKWFLRDFLGNFQIPEDDIHFSLIDPWGFDGLVAEGYFFIRCLSRVDKDETLKVLKLVLEKKLEPSGVFKGGYSKTAYDYTFSLPLTEDPDKMMVPSISPEKIPTLAIKEFPTSWFTKKGHSSQGLPRLLPKFFRKFGNIRDIKVEDEEVLVEYEDQSSYYRALQALCGFSLQKEGVCETVDYIIRNREEVSGGGDDDSLSRKRKRESEDPLKKLINRQREEEGDIVYRLEREVERVKAKIDEAFQEFLRARIALLEGQGYELF